MNFLRMYLFFMTVSLVTVSTRARYYQRSASLNDADERGTNELADEPIVKRDADTDEENDGTETTTFYMSPEREEELLTGEGFGTELEAEKYFGNITRKNCKDDDENAVLYIVCQYAKECSHQASTESECIVDIAKVCKYNEIHEGRRCVNHMMAHVKFYRDFGAGGLGPKQIAEGLTKEDVERDRSEKKNKNKNKKSKKGSKNGASKSPDGGDSGTNSGNALSSLLGGTKNSPGLLGGPGHSHGLLG